MVVLTWLEKKVVQFFLGNECLFIGESRTMQVYAAKTVYKAGFAIGQKPSWLVVNDVCTDIYDHIDGRRCVV